MNRSPISILQEHAQIHRVPWPSYKSQLIGNNYRVTLTFGDSREIFSEGIGRSQQLAKQLCATNALNRLKINDSSFLVPISSTNDISSASQPSENYVGELNELCAKRMIDCPQYINLTQINSDFLIKCFLMDNIISYGQSKIKKEAKQLAAKSMLKQLNINKQNNEKLKLVKYLDDFKKCSSLETSSDDSFIPSENYVGILNEFCSKRHLKYPTYVILGIDDDNYYIVECKMNDGSVAYGRSKNKKTAKQIAAERMLTEVLKFEQFCDEKESVIKEGSCTIESQMVFNNHTRECGKTESEAKQKAARAMLTKLKKYKETLFKDMYDSIENNGMLFEASHDLHKVDFVNQLHDLCAREIFNYPTYMVFRSENGDYIVECTFFGKFSSVKQSNCNHESSRTADNFNSVSLMSEPLLKPSNDTVENYVEKLSEACRKRMLTYPSYKEHKTRNGDFVVECEIFDKAITQGQSESRGVAKQRAAQIMLQEFTKKEESGVFNQVIKSKLKKEIDKLAMYVESSISFTESNNLESAVTNDRIPDLTSYSKNLIDLPISPESTGAERININKQIFPEIKSNISDEPVNIFDNIFQDTVTDKFSIPKIGKSKEEDFLK